MLYNNLSGYFRKKYGHRLSKICIDGGFSCPNRDGTCSAGGCIFCGERGSGEHIDPTLSIKDQVKKALDNARPDDKFIVYFQNFTNTYADITTLKERYDAALIDNRIVALAIGTRPDCIDKEKATLIASYKKKYDVWVELGLQTANDETAIRINRGYKTEVFEQAVEILHSAGIDVVTHIIIGLPGEGVKELKETVDFFTRHHTWGLKIHSLYVMKGTALEKMYNDGKFSPISMDEYVECAVYVIKNIPKDTVIHRLTGDCPNGLLVAPEWNKSKHKVIEKIQKRLGEKQ